MPVIKGINENYPLGCMDSVFNCQLCHMKDLRPYLPKFDLKEASEYAYQFTVFVPVYNAEKTIDRVFKSLGGQIFRDFEVIMINDGSKDATDQVIRELLPQASFEIRYINNEINKNKMGILLEAVQLARGEFFIVHDSDDEIRPEGLLTLLEEYEAIPNEMKPQISGVTCCCVNQFGERIGDQFLPQPFYSNPFIYRNIDRISGEKWGFNKTRILQSIHANPEIFGRGLIPESFLWLTISHQGYQYKYINDTLRIYHVDMDDNLSSLGYEKKALGMAIYALIYLNNFYKKYFLRIPILFFKRVYSLLKASKSLDFSLGQYTRSIDSPLFKFMMVVFWPFRKMFFIDEP